MRDVLAALREGAAAARRSVGLALVLLAANVVLAAVAAVPVALALEAGLRERPAATPMLYGFDYPFWSEWVDGQKGANAELSPAILGAGLFARNLELLLAGRLPAGLLPAAPAPDEAKLDSLLLGLGALYMVVHTFLAGGVLAVLRAPREWKARALLHGSAFYFGRLLRLSLLVLAAAWVLFRVNVPFAAWANRLATEAVSETTATAILLGRHLALLAAIAFLHLVSSTARVIVVLEERTSALLALASALSFCLRRFVPAAAHFALLAAAGALLAVLWLALDAALPTTGYRTQIVTFLLFQGYMTARMSLRIALWAGQMALQRNERLG